MPTDEHGECVDHSKPVETDYREIYDILLKWNVIATEDERELNSYLPWWFPAFRATVKGAGGRDEYINFQCLCLNTDTQEIKESDVHKISYFNTDLDEICPGDDYIPIFNGQDYYD